MLNFFYKNMKNKKGFTLVELIVVMAILGILAAVAVPKFQGVQRSAQVNADVASAKIIADAAALAAAQGDIAADTADEASTILVGGTGGTGNHYLQSYPAPQACTGTFDVTINDTTGAVTVSVTVAADNHSITAGTYELYPSKVSTYK